MDLFIFTLNLNRDYFQLLFETKYSYDLIFFILVKQ
jgi:hypothetical protein